MDRRKNDLSSLFLSLTLSDIVMQTRQVHLQIDTPLMGIVYLLVET